MAPTNGAWGVPDAAVLPAGNRVADEGGEVLFGLSVACRE